MKLAIVYNPQDNKLAPETYSYTYRGMLDAVIKRWGKVVSVTGNCNASKINADVILFYDVNSNHEVEIKDVDKHPALKIEYMSDPHQSEVHGIYQSTLRKVHKLSASQRLERAKQRGVSFIISPTKEGYFRYFAPILGRDVADKMLWYFPHAPSFDVPDIPLSERNQEILGNGATWDSGLGAYEMRKWAFNSHYITVVNHAIKDGNTPKGKDYGKFLTQWAGALALSEMYPVNKYYEMPMAGCVTFAQYHHEYESLGFKDLETCIYVDRSNFEQRVKDFLNDIQAYQKIADAGRKLMLANYTAENFAEFLHDKIQTVLGVEKAA